MAKELIHVDVTNTPDILRLAEDVAKTRVSKVLTRGDEVIAVLSPAGTARRTRTDRRRTSDHPTAWLERLAGIADAGEPTDVATHKDRYIADAIYAESQRDPDSPHP